MSGRRPARAASEEAMAPPAQVLIVEDDEDQRWLLTEILAQGPFYAVAVPDAESALVQVEQQEFDVLLVDRRLPRMSGDELVRELRDRYPERYLAVVMISGYGGGEAVVESLREGALDFIRKPFRPDELLARISVAARTKRSFDAQHEVEHVYLTIARMVEARDWSTGQHCTRLAHNSVLFGRYLGLDRRSLDLLGRLGVLHDIGKLAVPDRVLLKTGRFTARERRIMETHAVVGARLCQEIRVLRPLATLVRHHHERWDGSGYPDGLAEEEIPYLARVFQLLDIHDALSAVRPYKDALPPDQVVRIMRAEREEGRLDPDLSERFFAFLEEMGDQLMRPESERPHHDDFFVEEVAPVEDDADPLSPEAVLEQTLAPHEEMPAIMVLGRDGRVVYSNEQTSALLGLQPGMQVTAVDHPNVRAPVHRDGLVALKRCPVQRALEARKPVYDEEVLLKRDGKEQLLRLTVIPLPGDDGVVGSAGVVVSLREACFAPGIGERLRVASAVFEHMRDGILVVDRRGLIESANHAACMALGRTESGLVSLPLANLFPQADLPPALPPTSRNEVWLSDATWDGEVDLEDGGEADLPVHLRITAVFGVDGVVEHYLAVFFDISRYQRRIERLQQQAGHDALTGLPNRELFLDRLDVALHQARRRQRHLALLFIDLDDFKDVNDIFGHETGDRLLMDVAQVLQQQLRDEDTVARLGGDEFVVLLADVASLDAALGVARKLRHHLRHAVRVQGEGMSIDASIGVSLYPDHGKTADELMRHADLAMYYAKGRDGCHAYRPELRESAMQRVTLQTDLRRALESDQLALHACPWRRLSDTTLSGLQLVPHWRRPRQGSVPLTPYLGKGGLGALDRDLVAHVLEQAIGLAGRWHRERRSFGRLALRLHPHQLEEGDLSNQLEKLLQIHGVPGHCLELQIPEQLLTGLSVGSLSRLRMLGIRLGAVDFGLVGAPLASLRRLPLDVIRLDRELTCNLPAAERDRLLVRGLVGLGRDLGVEMIADGVERESQLAFLRDVGCDAAQGALIGEVQPIETIEAWLRRQ
ncbi:MAG: diguanylate cyclase [Gammaproteobacteria bacterium]|nr:MAG: diguanylate cyclase [Gammaproteobacteria bacterium]